jgi:ComEC/Rec2-related protein
MCFHGYFKKSSLRSFIRSKPAMTAYRCATLCVLCFIVGLIPGTLHFTPPTWAAVVPVLAGLAGCWIVRKPRRVFFSILLCATAAWSGWLYVSVWRSYNYRAFRSGYATGLHGVLVQPADVREKDILYTVALTNPKARDGRGGTQNGTVLVIGPLTPLLHYGDEIRFSGLLKSPAPFSGFDYPLFLERFSIYANVRFVHKVVLLRRNRGNYFLARLYDLRARIEEVIRNSLPEPQSSFLQGIMVGDKRSIPADIRVALQNTGTVHIIVTSGSNITVLVEVLSAVLPFRTQRGRFLTTLCVSAFFSLLTGAPASVLRGATVATLGAYVRARSRRAWPVSFVLVAMVLLLVVNPMLLVADPGFQVSFAAFAGLAFFGGMFRQAVERIAIVRRLPYAIKESFAASLAATAGISGISLHLFGQLSFLGLLVNPVALWLLVPITFLGLLLCVVGGWPPLGHLVAIPIEWLLKIEIGIIQFFGHANVGIVRMQAPWWLVGVIYCLVTWVVRGIRPKPPNGADTLRQSVYVFRLSAVN